MTNRKILMDLCKELVYLDTRNDEASKKLFLIILEDVVFFSKEVVLTIKGDLYDT